MSTRFAQRNISSINQKSTQVVSQESMPVLDLHYFHAACERHDALVVALQHAITIQKMTPSEERLMKCVLFMNNVSTFVDDQSPKRLMTANESMMCVSKEGFGQAIWQGFLAVIDAIRRALVAIKDWFMGLFSKEAEQERALSATAKTVADLKKDKAEPITPTAPVFGAGHTAPDLPPESDAVNPPSFTDPNVVFVDADGNPAVVEKQNVNDVLSTLATTDIVDELVLEEIEKAATAGKIFYRIPPTLIYQSMAKTHKCSLKDIVEEYETEVIAFEGLSKVAPEIEQFTKVFLDLATSNDMSVQEITDKISIAKDSARDIGEIFRGLFPGHNSIMIYECGPVYWMYENEEFVVQNFDASKNEITFHLDPIGDIEKILSHTLPAINKRRVAANKHFLQSFDSMQKTYNILFTTVQKHDSTLKQMADIDPEILDELKKAQKILLMISTFFKLSAAKYGDIKKFVDVIKFTYKKGK